LFEREADERRKKKETVNGRGEKERRKKEKQSRGVGE